MTTLRVSRQVVIAFVVGVAVGGATLGIGAQASRWDGNKGVNHVGIVVDDMDQAIASYARLFGFEPAAVLKDDKGQTTLAFIQVSRDTFVELAPASPTRRAGIDHFGLEVENVRTATDALRQRGVKVEDPRKGRTVTTITTTTDPTGVRMELSELGPDSTLGKAIANWK
jgi:catechol 2,3-dioxygenase-like lactoylglutathione lyase family enzyme